MTFKSIGFSTSECLCLLRPSYSPLNLFNDVENVSLSSCNGKVILIDKVPF